jgi:hypothetical protein
MHTTAGLDELNKGVDGGNSGRDVGRVDELSLVETNPICEHDYGQTDVKW